MKTTFGQLSKSVLLFLMLFATWNVAEAGSAVVSPDRSWTKEQQTEFWIGAYGKFLKMCGYFTEGSELEDLASLSPYGRQVPGLGYDEYGGDCAELKEKADKYFLSRKDELRLWLSKKYGQTVQP